MIFRRLFALLLALAMTFAPLGVPAMAEAAGSASHHGDLTGQAHCDQQPQPDPDRMAPDKSCCVAMCIAVVVPADAANLPTYHSARERPPSDLERRGFLAETATPPPKPA